MQFSFKRFCYLFRLQLAANKKRYLLGIAALGGVLLALMLFFMADDDGLTFSNQQVTYTLGLFLSAGIFGATFFKQFAVKSQRIQALMLPVSHVERLSVAILFVLVIFPLVYSAVCFLCLRLMNFVDVHWLGHFNPWYYGNDHLMVGFALAYFYFQALLLLGAIWFRKYTFVKTAVMVCLVAICLTGLNDLLGKNIIHTVPATTRDAVMKKLSPDITELEYAGTTPYLRMSFVARGNVAGRGGEMHYSLELPPAGKTIMAVILLAVPFFLWFITLLKLREQQL